MNVRRWTYITSRFLTGIPQAFLALTFILTTACSQGNQSIDDFIGDTGGDDETPTYSLDFDPSSWDFGPLITTSPTALSKSITVNNNSGIPLYIQTVGSTASTHFTLVSETCSATGSAGMSNGDSCTFVVEFKPTAGGLHNFAVNIGFTVIPTGGVPQTASVNFLGTGALPANLVVSDGPTYDYGAVVATAIAEHSFTVTNAGNYPASSITGGGLAAPFAYKGGSYPGTGGTCGTTLAAGASCTMVGTFNPLVTGVANDTIELTYDNGDTTVTSTRDIAGTGATAAVLSISDSPGYDYGTFAVGASSDKSFTITNSGGVTATSLSGSGLVSPFAFKGGTFPGAGGTCASTLASSGSCTIIVTYAPVATGSVADNIEIGYNDGLNTQLEMRAVQGTAVAPANLSINNGPTYNYGTLVVTGTADATFTISNTGGFNASFITGGGLAAPFSFKGGSFPGAGGNCAASLAAGSSCSIVVTYAPTVAGSFSDAIDIGYVNGASAQTSSRAVQGLAVDAAVLAISDGPTYDYGTRPTGSTQDKSLTVTNTGGTPATGMSAGGLAAPFSFKGGSYPGTGGDCGVSLNPAAACTIVVTYAPVTVAVHSDSVDFAYNNGLGPVNVARAVTGTGVSPAALAVSDGPSYDYGMQPIGKTIDKVFTLTNSGGFQAASIAGGGIAAPFTFKGGSFPGTGGTCTATLASSTSCTFVVTYTVAAAAASSDTADITYNDGVVGQTASRDVLGTGVTAASITISDGPTYDYGPVATGDTVEKTLTISNAGTFTASAMTGVGLAAPFTFKGGTYPGTGGTCASTLAGGGNCTVIIVFAPTATGNLSDTLDMNYFNGVSAQTSSRALQGVGTLPATLVISDGPTYNFGTLPYGAAATKSFTVTNAGGVPASTMAGGGLAAPYTYLGGSYPGAGGNCSTTLAASANCSIVVEYNPTAAATHNDSIEITYFDEVNNQTSTRDVTGIAVNPASLSISGGPTYSFGTVAVGGSAEATLTVTNGGQFAANSMSGSGLAAPYTFKGGSYPGTGGTCSTTLNAAGTCTLVLVYAPSGTGVQNDTVDLAYNNGVSAQTAQRDITGTGAAPASLSLSDGATYDYGSLATGASLDKTFTLSNTGGVTATSISGGGLAAPYSFKGGTYPGTGGTCTTSLNASSNCTIIVTFAPSSTGVANDTIDISYHTGAASSSTSRDVTGTGVTPATLTLSDGPTYDFGTIPSTGSAEKILTITNSGAVAATAMSGSGLAAPFTFKGGSYPGTGGTCGASVAASGGTCTVVVVFNPTSVSAFNDTVDISYHNGASTQTASRALQGAGAAPGSLTISDGPTYNFGSWPNGDTREKSFTVTNAGGVAATSITGGGLAAPYTFKGGSYPGAGGTCSTSLNPAGTCTIIVQYSPTALGATSDTIELNYSNGLTGVASTRDVAGTAVAPASITISDGATYDFGTIAVGGSTEKTFTLLNAGGFAASSLSGSGLAAPYTFKGGSYPGTGGTCGSGLNVAASCTVIVVYAPTATGVQNDTIDIAYNDGVTPQTSQRDITGTGAAPALLSVSDGATYNYGTWPVGSATDKSFTITNSGGVTAASIAGSGLAAPFSFKGGTFPGTGGTCTATLSASGTCTVIVTFAPTATGTPSDAIDISYNDGVNAQSTSRAIAATAVDTANITISNATTYDFGTRANGSSTDFTFTVTNAGAYSASSMTGGGLAAPFVFKGGAYPGTGGDCGASLAPAGTCLIVVTYSPTVSGAHTYTIDINYNNGAVGTVSQRPVQGTGAPPASLAITDGPIYSFGTRATTSSTDHTLTVTNNGGVPATALNATGLAAPYTFKGGTYPGTGGNCGTSLAGSASCTIVVTYNPTSTGVHNDTLDIAYADGIGANSVSRDVTGTGAAPASITITDGPTYDYGTLAAGGSAEKTFTLQNTGGVPATSVTGGGLAAPYAFKGGSYPGTAATCGATLTAGATCTITVVYSPTVGGTHLDTIDISYNNGLSGVTSSRDLQGTAVAPAFLAISDGATFNFGTIPSTSSADKVFTVDNTGSLAATSIVGSGLAAPFTFKGGSYPGTGGTCGTSLNGGANCTIVVTFAPPVDGSSNDTIELAYYDGAANQNSLRPIQGTGAPPASLTISDGATFNFGNIANGGTADKTFNVTNNGGVGASAMAGTGLAAPYTFKGGTYPGTGGTCGTTLAVTVSCTIVVNFNPTSLGVAGDSIEINYNDGLAVQTSTRAVTGTSVNPALLTIADGPTYDYGTWATGSTRNRTFNVTNSGDVTATSLGGSGLAAPFSFKDGSFPGGGGTCTTNLNAGATCTIVVSYSPTATGTQGDVIEVNYNNGAAPVTATRAIQGTGAAPASLSLSDGPTYDFGTLASGGTADKTITVTNGGGVFANTMSGSGLAAPYSFKGGSYPGAGGTCGASLAAAGTCTIVINYNPSTVATHTDTVDVTYDDGVNNQTASRALTGTAVSPASISISDGTTYNYGTLANGASADKTFTLTNGGSFSASSMSGGGLAAPYTFKGGSYPGSGGSCAAALAPAGTCTIVVTFSPVATGVHNDAIDISYNDGAAVQTSSRNVTGTGAPPAVLAISDGPTFDFGTRATGSSTDKSFSVQNTGGVPATSVGGSGIAAPYTFKDGTYPGTGGNCGTTIAAGATCTVVVTYAPVGTGSQSDALDMGFNDGVTTQTSSRALQGTGAAPASLAISDGATYDFGSIATGGFSDKTFTITNSGGVPATSLSGGGLAAPYTFKGGTFPGTGGTCTGGTLAGGGATCTFVVSFAPSAAGVQTDTVDITFNNGVSAGQSTSRDLTGTGVTPALLTISDGPTFGYGAVVATGSMDKTFTVNNSGSLAATTVTGGGLAAPFSFKGGSFPGTGGNCGSTINSGATCSIVVTFAPGATGSFSDTIDLNYNDGANAVVSQRDVTGTGATAASITISDGATFDFGNLAQGSSADKTFTLTNGGGVPATALTGSGLAAPYSFKGGSFPGTGATCVAAGTIAAAASCTIVVTYNPATVATHNDTIDIGYSNALATVTSSRDVTGTGVTPAIITISDGATYDFGTVATGGSAEKSFTLQNTGAFTATSVGGSGLAAPFSFKGGSFPGTGGSCTATINVGASCSVVVVYAPSATGTQSDAIDIGFFNGASSQTSSRAVQGTGAAPATLTISDGPGYDYGLVANGSSTDKSFTVTNTGGVPATGINGGGLAAPYSFKGGTFPGSGGTCSATLAGGSTTCSIVVTYNPTTNATHNDAIDIAYTDGVSGQSVSRTVTGQAVAPASITISDGATFSFGTVANGSSNDKTFTLTNSGAFTASSMSGGGLAAPYTFKGGTYPGSGGTCSTTLAASGTTCTIVVTFAPSSSATHNDTIDISYSNGAAVQTASRDVTGISAAPATLAISDGATFDFSTRATGSSTDKTFSVQNTGGVDATSVTGTGLAAPFTFKGGTYPGTGGTCGATIAAAATCNVVVTYAPAGTGAHSDTMDIGFNDGVTTTTSSRAMQGIGAAPANITISETSPWDFGSIANGGTADKSFTVSNTGGVPATSVAGGGLAAPYSFKGGTYPGTSGGDCGATLAAGASCTVVVTFAPVSAGVHTDTLDITYNNGVAAGQTTPRDLTGTGVAPALLTITDGPTYNYGAVVVTGLADKSFTVTNTGSLQATSMSGTGLAAPFTFKGGAYPGTGGNCGATLAASGTCTIVVTFNPSATGGSNDTIDMNYNNGVSVQVSQRDIQGTGATAASITISDGATYNFGTVAQGSTSDKTLTLTNGGGVTATSMSGSGLAAPFTFKGGSYPGTGGTCTTDLAASATCTVVVNYNPTNQATHNDTMDIGYNDGLAAQTSSRPLQGTSVAPASITISDGATYDFGTLATGASGDKTFTLTNGGAFAASSMTGGGLAAPFTFKGGSYPGTGGTCSATLNGSSSTCTIVVSYSPVATGTQSDSIEINYNDGAAPQTATRAVQGTGATPATLTISDGTTFNYGTVAQGSSTDKSFTVTNTGGVPATGIAGSGLVAPYSFKGGTYPGGGGSCSTSLAAGANCTIVVTYNPSSTGVTSDDIDISYHDGATPGQSVSRGVQGTAVGPASISISDGTTYNFGTVANGSSNDKSFTLTNSGSFTASTMTGSGLAAPYSFKGGSYPGSGGNCSTTLAPAGTCTVVVTFAPTVSGTHNDTIDIPYNNGATSPTAQRDVTGVSAPPATMVISDAATYNFGTRAVGSTIDKTFTVQNTGGVGASSISAGGIAAPYTFKGGSYPGTGGDCGTTLAAGATCSFVVTYAPTGTGTQNDSVDFQFNDGVTATQTSSRAITGTGAAPANITITESNPYDFGNIANGGTVDKSFTITNTGGVNATSMSGAGLAAPYTFKGGTYPGTSGGDCAATLAPAATCTVVVTFAPASAGTHTDTLDITYNNGVAAGQTSSRDLTGVGVAPALLTISDGATFSYGAVVATGSADKTFTITNTGTLQATSVGGTGLAAPFSFKGGSFPGSGGTCAATLAGSNTTCTIVVTFNPSVVGSFSDTIDLGYNNGVSVQTSSRDVTGTGATAASITISDGATFNFGTVANGSSTDKTFTLTNGGGVPATALSGSGLAAPYTFKGGTFPGTGGTCTNGGALAAAATCNIVVNYNPTTVATHNDTIDVGYNDGLAAQTSSRAMTGTAVAPASLTISDGATYDFGTLATGATLDKTFTVTNAGDFTASGLGGSGLAAPFTFKGGSFPGSGGTCSATLNGSNATCTIVVTYAPSATGSQSDTIEVTYNDGAAPQTATRAIQGTGAAPALLTISDGTTFDFGPKSNGSSTDKSFTVTNTGGVTATSISGGGLAAPYTFKGGTFPGTGGTCTGGTLAASGTCSVVVTFNPTGTGTHNDTIDITYHNGAASGQTVSRDITGTSTPPAVLTISDAATFNFGSKANGSSTDKTFTVTNGGSFTASGMGGSGLAAPYSFKGGSYPGSGGNCSTTLGTGGNCTIVVTYAPTVTGTHNDTVDITYNDGTAAQTAQRDVTATSAPPATLLISDAATYDYGTKATGSSTDKTFTVQNTGGIDATSVSVTGLAAPFLFKGGTYPGTGGTCGTSIISGATCSIVVTYSPAGTGAHSDSIDFTFNDGVTASQTSSRGVQGTGASPATLTISDGATYDFGNIATGGTSDKTFTIQNTGGVSATSVSGGGLAAPYTFKGGTFPGGGGSCTATIAAGASCSVVVTFAPTVGGVQTDTFDLTFNNGVAAGQTSSRDLTGTGITPASLAISDGVTFDYGPVVATGAADKSFTITNSGMMQATGMGGASGLAAPFSYKGGTYPGTGGNCGATLSGSGATCTIVVTFAPSATGGFSDTIDFAYNNGVGAQTSSRDIQGTGATAASITISDGATFSFGTVAQGSTTDKTFTLTNGGGVSATALAGAGLAAPYTFKGGSFPGTGGTCVAAGTLAGGGGTCTIVVNYNPSTIATHTDTIDVNYNNGLSAQTAQRDLTGTAIAPASLTISDAATYDFGSLATGASGEKIFTITNTAGAFTASGMSGAGLAAPFTFKGGSFPGTGGTCSGGTLNGGSSCTMVVVYAPTGTGAHNDTIDVNYNDGASAQVAQRPVTGTGAAPANISISDGTTYDFGLRVVGTATDKTFTLTNSGGVTATSLSGAGLAAPYTFKGGTFPGTGGTCTGGTLAGSSATCTIVVTFTPAGTGVHNDTIDITYNNGVAGGQSSARDVTGTGATAASLSISETGTYDYGNVAVSGTGSDKTFTVTNSGGFLASGMGGASGLAAPFTYKDGTYPGTGGNCGGTLAGGGATCTIVVSFAPTSTGAHSDQIDFAYNDGTAGQTAVRPIQGTGAAPASLTISDAATFNFGTVANGSSNDKTFTVSNGGGVSATALGGAGLAAPYTFKGGAFPGTGGTCTAAGTIAAGANCTIVVNYSPTTNATHNDTVDVTYHNGVSAQTAQRDVTGTAVAAANITITETSPYTYPTLANGASADHTFTLTNAGGFTASNLNGAGLAAPFSFKGGTFPGTGGSCTAAGSLGASGTCTIVVTFAPGTSGSHSDTIDITYNNGASNQTSQRDVAGVSAAPALVTISESSPYDYGTVATTATKDRVFTVSNSGGVPATSLSGGGIAAPYSFKGGSFPGTGGSCTLPTIASGANCTIVVTFAPGSSATFTDTIDITYNNGLSGQTASRDVTGVGASPATLTMTDSPLYDYGTFPVGAAVDRTFTINNTGGVAATSVVMNGLAGSFGFKGGTYPGSGGNCGGTINAGANCSIVVTYSPASTANHSDTIDVSYNDGAAVQGFGRDIQGTGSTAALITVSDGATFNYNSRATGGSTDKTFTLTNSGGVAATSLTGAGLAAPYSFKGGSFPGTGGNCTATLAGGSSQCTVVVTYSPTTVAVHNDTIEIDYNDGLAAAQATRAVTGTGVAPASLLISDGATFDYGSLYNGQSSDKTFTVTNSGTFAASSMAGTGIASPFTFKDGTYPGTGGTCGTSLAGSGSTCSIVVTFAPSTANTWADTIDLNYNDGANAQTAQRALLGASADPVAPSAPGTPAIAITAFSQLDLTWTGSATGTGPITYAVWRTETSGSGHVLVQGGIAGTSYVDTAVTAGTTYYYEIRATGLGGTTSSAESTASVPIGTFQFSGAPAVLDRALQVSWGAAAGATAYTVRYGTVSGTWGSVASTSATSPYTVTGLTAGTTYYVMVQATNSKGSVNAALGEVSGIPKAVASQLSKSNGQGDAICTILSNGDVKCWGRALYGVLGNGSESQLGGDPDDVGDNVTYSSLSSTLTVSDVYTGGIAQHACAKLSDGSVKCWGRNNYGQLGYGDTNSRGDDLTEIGDSLATVQLGTGYSVAKMALGQDFTCALLTNGASTGVVKCFGRNTSGQLGQGTTITRGDTANEMADNLSPTALGTGRYAIDIAAGTDHACALLDNGDVKCWGEGNNGRLGKDGTADLGDGGGEMGDSLTAINLGTTAVQITAGNAFSCARLTGGTVKCWGFNDNGQLGQDNNTQYGSAGGGSSMGSLAAINLGAGRTATELKTGMNSTCAILDDNTMKCWGYGTSGGLGRNNTTNMGTAANPINGMGAISVSSTNIPTILSVGQAVGCVRLNDASTRVKCWGANGFGQLGMGDNGGIVANNANIGDQAGEMGDPLPFMSLPTGRTAAKIVAGRDNVFVVLDDGKLVIFGDNNFGRLVLGKPAHAGDDPSEMGSFLTKVNLGTGLTAKKIATSSFHSCAILSDDKVKCWGRNNFGQLGYGDMVARNSLAQMGDSLAYVDIGTGVTAKDIAVGDSHTCIIDNSNNVKCWGRNNAGQLGINNVLNQGDQGGEMGASLGNAILGQTAKMIAAGAQSTCAILADDTLKCWGLNSNGQLGKDNTTNYGSNAGGSSMASGGVVINLGQTVKYVAMGNVHVCAILLDDSVKCWGNGGNGRLGQNATTTRGDNGGEMAGLAAINLGAGRTAKKLQLGSAHSCAILDNNSVKCWGAGNNGRLGYGNTTTYGSGGTPNSMTDIVATFVNMGTSITAKDIWSGVGATCVIGSDDEVRCWGQSAWGTLGQEQNTNDIDAAGEMGDNLPLTTIW